MNDSFVTLAEANADDGCLLGVNKARVQVAVSGSAEFNSFNSSSRRLGSGHNTARQSGLALKRTSQDS